MIGQVPFEHIEQGVLPGPAASEAEHRPARNWIISG
jgi:hypothetical protein